MDTADRTGYAVNKKVMTDVLAERNYQLSLGFTIDRDNDVFPHQWIDMLRTRVDMADSADAEGYRTQLVKVAAIAVAAVEAYDRLS